MTIGEIYFILERDRMDGQHSSYVKIGLVKSVERNSEARLLDHQTGNPRDLILHHVIRTPSPYWVERGLHQRLGRKRVRGEWFILAENELIESISLAEQLANEALRYSLVLEEAEQLKNKASTQVVLPATPDAAEWLDFLSKAHIRIKACVELENAYNEVFRALTPEEQKIIEEEELVTIEHYVDSKFDAEGFRAAYPHLYDAFVTVAQDITGKFTPNYGQYSIREIDRELADFDETFRQACAQVLGQQMTFTELAELKRDLESWQNAYEWEKKIADANLRVLCGDAAGIDGICTWKRVVKDSIKFDELGLQSNHPDEYQQFLTVTTKSRTKTKKRPKAKITS